MCLTAHALVAIERAAQPAEVASTFYDDLRGLLFTMLDEDNVDTDYIPPDVPNATAYPVDYRFPGRDGRSVFLYGVPGRDKARLTTIMLSHFLLHGLTFESVSAVSAWSSSPLGDGVSSNASRLPSPDDG